MDKLRPYFHWSRLLTEVGSRAFRPRVAMRDTGLSPEDLEASIPVRRSAGFALEVINRLIARKSTGTVRVLEHLLDRLVVAARAVDAAPMETLLQEMRHDHVNDEAIVAQYIPAAARILGKAWEDDTLSFLDVTMGAARLADLLREVGGDGHGDDRRAANDMAVLLVVPPGEQHMLGAAVLACQMRQGGTSVCLRFGPTLTELSTLLATRRFDGAIVSVGGHDRIETGAVLVKTLHALTKGNLPVAVGGCILDQEKELLKSTGADLVSNDLDEALALFRIKSVQEN
jgi:methylmalonyl-CoA mutase cobalamin-binding subunit